VRTCHTTHLHNQQLHLVTRSLRQLPPPLLPSLLASVSRLPPAAWPSKAWCVGAMGRLSRGLASLSPSGLALSTWALGRLGLRLRPDYADKLCEGYARGIGSADPRALALMAAGLAGCGWRPPGLWVGVFLARAAQQLPAFSGRDLAMMLWGLVQLR
jgi:hypothetical protein